MDFRACVERLRRPKVSLGDGPGPARVLAHATARIDTDFEGLDDSERVAYMEPEQVNDLFRARAAPGLPARKPGDRGAPSLLFTPNVVDVGALTQGRLYRRQKRFRKEGLWSRTPAGSSPSPRSP